MFFFEWVQLLSTCMMIAIIRKTKRATCMILILAMQLLDIQTNILTEYRRYLSFGKNAQSYSSRFCQKWGFGIGNIRPFYVRMYVYMSWNYTPKMRFIAWLKQCFGVFLYVPFVILIKIRNGCGLLNRTRTYTYCHPIRSTLIDAIRTIFPILGEGIRSHGNRTVLRPRVGINEHLRCGRQRFLDV